MKWLLESPPVQAIWGAFKGLEDGMRGKIDTNEKFSDGYRENDPKKKSMAGQFASDYLGIRGGAELGQKWGKWAGAAVSAVGSGLFLFSFAAAMTGAWPLIAAGLLTGAAAFVGGGICHYAGKYIGGALGMVAGGVVGTVVGFYNGLFGRGANEKAESPDKKIPVKLDKAPQSAKSPHQGDPQSKSAGKAQGGEAPQASSAPKPAAPDKSGGANVKRAQRQAATGLGDGSISKGALASVGTGAEPPQTSHAERFQQQGVSQENAATR